MEKVAKADSVPSAQSPDPAAGVRGAHAALGLRVREVLGVSSLAGARVLAGTRGLDRIVQRLNVMEVPDILPWVKPHELLLTTGYPLRHDPQALVGLVAELDSRGLAALAVKLHRYLDEVPAAALAEADRRGFPVIEFPAGVGFDDVLNEVLSEVLNRQAAVLARSEEVHRALVTVVLDGGDLADLAAELARILDGTVAITTPDGRVLAHADGGDDISDRVPGLRGPDRARGSDRAPGGPDPADEAPRLSMANLPPGLRDGTWAVVPIVAGRVDHGRIVAFSRVPLTDADIHGLERAATVAALAITKRLAVAAVESKYRADFLRDLLTGRVEDLSEAVGYARTFGWEIDRPLIALVAELDPPATGGEARKALREPGVPAGERFPGELGPLYERFTAAWQSVVRWRDPRAAVAHLNQEVVALVGVPGDGDVNRLVAPLDRLVRSEGTGGHRSFSLGISRTALAPGDLPRAYEQARTAVRIGRRLHGGGARTSFDRLGVHRLLALVPDTAELRAFAEDVLGELTSDSGESADLRNTLAVLLDTNCNVAAAARRLHFHYNTLRYRIEKLERMVGPFTREASLRLDLALALRVLELRR